MSAGISQQETLDIGTSLNASNQEDDADPKFCNTCAAITFEALWSESGYIHVADVRELKTTWQLCDLCFLIVRAVIESARYQNAVVDEAILTLDDALRSFQSAWRRRNVAIQEPYAVLLKLSRDLPNVLNIDVINFAANQYHTAHQPLGYLLLHGSSGVDQPPLRQRQPLLNLLSWLATRLWAKIVDGTISASIPEAKLPDRVLDISQSKVNGKIHLVETLGRIHGSYTTLSYCWGDFRGFLTEHKSYQDRCNGIDITALPTLFRDAGFITACLGLKYLWIDALCIIQDSEEDWEKQASQMADIYRNCAVRIAATAARDPSYTFFPPQPMTASVRMKNIEGQRPVYHHEGKCYATLPRRYNRDVDMARLNSRAWVVQERLLAPRTIHICEDHIYIETDHAGIIGEDDVPQFALRFTNISKEGTDRGRLMQTSISKRTRNYDDTNDTSGSWQKIAEMFSACRITYPTDKLIAISGLISDRQEHGKFPYRGSKNYVGMWESTLHEDLLWISMNTEEFLFLSDLNLPTWAWIAYQGPVKFLKDRRLLRDRRTMQVSPIPEFELLEVQGSCESTRLPLPQRLSLSVKLKLAKIPALGSKKLLRPAYSHEEITYNSPFRHWPGTYNRPIPLVRYDDCFRIKDSNGNTIGYLSMDTKQDALSLDLWCAHIATLHDETYRGPDPLSRYAYARDVDRVMAITRYGVGNEYKDTTDSHILAYCLVVSPQDTTGTSYKRYGIAEVQYEWVNQASTATISLV